jgi:hypothetical protein
MIVRCKWDLAGPVHTCHIHRTFFVRQCGAQVCETTEQHHLTNLEFNEDGTLSVQAYTNPDGSQYTVKYQYEYQAGLLTTLRHIQETSVTEYRHEYDDQNQLRRVSDCSGDVNCTTEDYTYDAAGRKTKTQYLDVPNQRPDALYSYGVEGSDAHYSAPGAAKLITLYDERDLPVEILFQDAVGHLLNRVAFTYDADRHLIEELQNRPPEVFMKLIENVPPDEADAVLSALQNVAEPIRIRHRYEQGCRVETRLQFGLLSDQIETKTYDERGNQTAETFENHSREYGPDAEGQLVPAPGTERSSRSESRFYYEYDDYGNWTLRTVESRSDPEQAFSTCSTEKRNIRYFPRDLCSA